MSFPKALQYILPEVYFIFSWCRDYKFGLVNCEVFLKAIGGGQ